MARSDRISRRRLLQLLAGGSAIGFSAGVGTNALLRDQERFGGQLQASKLDLQIGNASESKSPAFGSSHPVDFSFEELDAGASGRAAIAVRSCDSPARVSLTLSNLSDGTSPLLEELTATATMTSPDGSADTLASGSLDHLLETVGDGYQHGPCIGCAPAVFTLDWTLPADAPSKVRGETVALRATFTATQCHGYNTTDS